MCLYYVSPIYGKILSMINFPYTKWLRIILRFFVETNDTVICSKCQEPVKTTLFAYVAVTWLPVREISAMETNKISWNGICADLCEKCEKELYKWLGSGVRK